MVKHRFGIDIYKNGTFQGTNYIDVDIDVQDEEIMSMKTFRKERLPADSILGDLYVTVYQSAYKLEEQRCQKHEYPYDGTDDFEEYSLKVFV